MNRKTNRAKDRHKAEAAVLVRMTPQEKEQIVAAADVAAETLPAHARTSTSAWILATALEAARQVKAGVQA